MSEACQILHQRLSNPPRFSPDARSTDNGIYVAFERGENAHGTDRIVHIGANTRYGGLLRRISYIYKSKKDLNIFRKHIGAAILKKRNDPLLDDWVASRGKINSEKQKQIEKEVSDYIKSNITFAIIPILDVEERAQLKSMLLSTINACPNCAPSKKWLGAHHTDSIISSSGLWNIRGYAKTTLSSKDAETLDIQTSQAMFLPEKERLPLERLPLFQNQPITNTAYKNKSVSSQNSTRGPAPSASSKGGIRSIDNPAVVYAFQFGDTEYWKVGKTNDINRRFDEVTKHVPEEYLGQNWKHAWEQEFPTETDAFNVEQRIFDCLAKYLTKNERIKCSKEILLDAWKKTTNH